MARMKRMAVPLPGRGSGVDRPRTLVPRRLRRDTSFMHFAGYVDEDTPDPAAERIRRIAGFGLDVAGFVAQRHLEDSGEPGVMYSSGSGEVSPDTVTVARTYLLWRNPDDHADPANLAELDDVSARSLDAPLERPLPPWLHEARRRMRYPHLWEAVQTHWWADGIDRPALAQSLIGQAEYILTNRFREQLGLGTLDDWVTVPERALQSSVVVVDGEERAGLLLDTDPFVFAVATALDDGRVLTAVVPRDDLPLITVAFRSSLPLTG